MRLVLSLVLSFALTLAAYAASPALPASAKKLTGPEIIALYDGNTVSWTDYVANAKGKSTFDFKKHMQTGSFVLNGKTIKFNSKISTKGDKFCFPFSNGKETCRFVYTSGKDIYEVDPASGGVISKGRKV